MSTRLLAAVLGVFCVLCSTCSVDERANPQRKSCKECERLGGKCITEEYCLLPSGTVQPDAGAADSGAPLETCGSEGTVELCYEAEDKSTAQQPPCRAGSRTCRSGTWSACEKQVLPKAESCNGSDDDCDGRLDEQFDSKPCDLAEQQGACQKGVQVCLAGSVQCAQVSYAGADTCNGFDDDCDGEVDESTSLRCYPDATGCSPSSTREGSYDCSGRCTTGARACVNGKYSDTCEGSVTPDANERCTEVGAPATDEDCDGRVDEGCACKAGVTCYTGSPADSQIHAPCRAGTQACTDATHAECTGEVTPKPEDCSNEGTDDDCDGTADNVLARNTPCSDASQAQGACKLKARWQCQDGKQVCVDGSVQPESCDGQGQDEDCDGRVDEGFDLQTDEAHCGACNAPCSQGLFCCAGTCVTTASNKSHCGMCGRACAGVETCCTGTCINTNTSAANCGSCGYACPLLNGCSAGTCKLLQ